ncbi:MAG: AarF/ABC1/UbiB kinase family protein, partial [Myxococcota bacterium]
FGAELFQIQRKHGMLGSPDFTLPILALLTYEGLVKNITPQLDFQKEAIPFTIRGLSAGL